MIGRLLDSLHTLIGRRRFEAEMDEELRDHLERQAADLAAAGIPPAEARRRAKAMFGAVEGFKEDAREARGIAWVDRLRGDVRFAFRTLRRSPGYAAVAILTLGLGIGANTTIFSVIDGVLLEPLPFPESDRLVRITASYPSGALPIYRTETRSYQAVATYTFGNEMNLLVDGTPERVRGRNVSAEFFDVLRVRAALGRTFQAGEDRVDAPLVAAISDNLWRNRLGADPAAIGRTIVIDGTPREIVGVLPRGFAFPEAGTDVWVPNRIDPGNVGHLWGAGGTTFIGRLSAGVTVAQANAEHRNLIPLIRDAYPWRMPDDFGLLAENRVRPLTEVIGERVEDRLMLLLAAVGLVLLVACANVANLNLTRVTARERELAVRRAIGGTGGRIGGQLVVEQLVLATVGGLVGLGFAWLGTPLLVRWLPPDTPRLDSVAVDGRVLLFTAAAVILSAILAAVGPAARAARSPALASLGSADRSAGPSRWGRRLSSTLVVAEIALAVVLLVGAGILLRSLAAMLRENPGVRVDGIVTASISQDLARCGNNMGACSVMFDRIEQSLATIPGVSGAALASMIPLDGQVAWFAMDVEDHPIAPGQQAHMLNLYQVTPDYFRIAGIRLEEGRLLDRRDTCADLKSWGPCLRDRGVVVVSRALADRYWPGRSALGRKIKPVWLKDWATIVGVVSDVRQEGLARAPTPDAYWAVAQWGAERMTAVLETSLPATMLEPEIRRAVAAVDPITPVFRIRSMASIVRQSVAPSRTSAVLLTLFAAVAMVLGALGVYGVLSYGVSQRRREIGIRMAIGAEPARVRRMIVGEAAVLVGAGLAAGIALAAAGGRVLERFVYAVGVRDPVTFALVPAVFLMVGLLAAYLPARRATRVSPTVALRAD